MEKSGSDTLFILGAGFTKAANSRAPLNRELVQAMGMIDKYPLYQYSDKYQTTDIERILTLIDIEIETDGNAILINDRRTIERQMANYFTRFRFNPASFPSWIEPFALTVLKQNDAILYLNYDCYLEGALDYFRVWSPNGGYPIINPLLDDIPPNPKNIMVYKVHGSEHFRESTVWGSTETGIGFLVEESIFPVSGTNKFFNFGLGNSLPYIIAPSYVKIPHVQIAYMMLTILEIAKGAKNIVIIGCGMRREDSFLILVLTRFLYGSSKELPKKLILLNRTSGDVLNRIAPYTKRADSFAEIITIQSYIEEGIEELQARLVSQ